ncbi:DUF2510 domain-containing protein [Leucobacter allii]|uniref:DUF2510 domain-containing protein n=1 Tax=Leucobacter allii TaxID=2932247 RepID=A0ABY4FL55_9MICO|nr:DUF2510 domain-containing protein [Leucobacter allii]UOQ57003.1 DUF2510 domain-containing protein [Leucobacter allii]UOR01472.1 DUF2510 domain-containing protein [Leucobacter allii]
MSQLPPPAGWYPDPEAPHRQRYWDGASWTAHLHEDAAQPVPAPGPIEPMPATAAAGAPRKRRGWIVWAAAGAVVLLGIAAAGVWGVTRLTSGLTAGAAAAAGDGGEVRLADADFYQRELRNLREMFPPEPTVALEQTTGAWGLRESPGYTAAARAAVEQVIADVEAEGETTFATLDDAESYAYSTLAAEIAEQTDGLLFGGTGTELATTGFPQDPAVVAIEQQIAAATVAPGADGSYLEAADALAGLVGSTITTDQAAAGCPEDMPDPAGVETLAFVCLGTEAGWGLITYTPAGMAHVTEPSFVNTMRHEIAHKLIHVQCGDLSATAWNAAYGEGVTNSYAALYLGADRTELESSGRAVPEYIMNETTDAKARAIHESDLACYDDEQLPEN